MAKYPFTRICGNIYPNSLTVSVFRLLDSKRMLLIMIFQSRTGHMLRVLAVSATLCTALATTVQSQTKSVVIGADPWCPFICDTGGVQQGLMVDIAKAALAQSGYKMSYKNISWARAKKMVRIGALDGIVGTANLGPEKTPYDFPQTALGVAEVCFYRRATDKWVYSSVQSLASRTMGWINDYGFDKNTGLNEWVKEHRETSQVLMISGTDTHPRLFKLLLAGRISTFAEDRYVIEYALKRRGLQDRIEVAGCTKPTEKVYVAFSAKTGRGVALAKALDKGVEKLRQNGRLADILRLYGLTEKTWVPGV